MTYHSRHWPAIDAVIEAGRGVKHHEPPTDLNRAPIEGQRPDWEGVDPRAAMVLSRILDVTPASTKPCVQFVPCELEINVIAVAVAVARAATAILGRSLLLNAHMDKDGDNAGEPSTSEALPDAFVHGLYHYRLAHRALDLDLLFGRGRRGALTAFIEPFQFVAINCCSPFASPTCTALATRCSGTVLIVRAGKSSRSLIKEVSLRITRAGGKVTGLVLDEAPEKLPAWIRHP